VSYPLLNTSILLEKNTMNERKLWVKFSCQGREKIVMNPKNAKPEKLVDGI
jgi:hypothetical protein